MKNGLVLLVINLYFNRFTISLRIRTYAKTGLILYSGAFQGNDFFSLKIKDGKPIFKFQTSMGSAEMVSEKSIDDGMWHKVWLCLEQLVFKNYKKLKPALLNL